MLYPPGSFDAAGKGYPNIGDLSDYVKDMPFTGYAVDDAWAAKNKPAIVGFLKGWRKAVDWFYDTKNRAEAVAILVKESGQTQDNIEKTYDYYRSLHIFPEDGTIDAKNLTALVQALAQMNTLAGPADPQALRQRRNGAAQQRGERRNEARRLRTISLFAHHPTTPHRMAGRRASSAVDHSQHRIFLAERACAAQPGRKGYPTCRPGRYATMAIASACSA